MLTSVRVSRFLRFWADIGYISESVAIITFDLGYVTGFLIVVSLCRTKHYRSWFGTVLSINISFPSLVGILLFSVLLGVI